MGETDFDALIANLEAFQTSSVGEDSPGGMMKKMITILFYITEKWNKGFETFKKDRHIIDYNDMERLFLKLLMNSDVEDEVKGTYKLLMVDEFQDSSPIQLEIFKRLSDIVEKNYWVGDPKQSIYGFRGADVELVEEVTRLFPVLKKEGDWELTEEEKKIEAEAPQNGLAFERLDKSWRSREPLVHLVNDCFIRAFKGVIHKDDVHLFPQREESAQFSYPLSHWNCVAANQNIFVDKVADKVRQLIDGNTQIQIKNTTEFRKIQPGDIAILCRSNNECKSFAKALVKKDVPVTFVNEDILQQTEVHLVFTLLKFLVDTSNSHVKADLLRLFEDKSTQEILQERLDYLVQQSQASEEESLKDKWLAEGDPLFQKLEKFSLF